ncbi:calcium-binding protein [Ralstonia pseudosolanacearum]|uniref:calcium-binding protein n=1 Tax=Ralstonia pseudosolanacearum TaxID=1310165 RepID=UPI0024A63A64|nr:calcium-binding protein [Ralstonia pseudosolanacearum]
MALPTAELVTNNYLYGTDKRPADLLDPAILNQKNGSADNSISVGAIEYMRDGAGRFVNSANFDWVEKFFNPVNSLAPGVYSKEQIFDLFGYVDPQTGNRASYAGYIVNQIYLGTKDPDYAERAYIWGTTKFKVADGAEFVVNADGSREVRNFAIQPDGDENFDFDGGPDSAIGNAALQPVIDPSKIGRTVRLVFDNIDGIQRTTLTEANFTRDREKLVSVDLIDKAAVGLAAVSAIENLKNGLFLSGSQPTRFLDDQNRPIIYGTNSDDAMGGFSTPGGTDLNQSEYQLGSWFFGKVLGLGLSSNLYPYLRNGVAYVAGDGNDSLVGTGYSDALYGGDGDDTLTGGAGSDTLAGGRGFDTYVIEVQSGSKTIIDSDDSGKIVFGGAQLTGAGVLQARTSSSIAWSQSLDSSQEANYDYDLGTKDLSISVGGAHVTVRNFESGSLGITVPQSVAPPQSPQPSYVSDATNTSAHFSWASHAGAGDDRTNDIRVGNGADVIQTGNGVNTIHLGAGQVTLTNYGGQDTINFASTVQDDQLWFAQDGNDLLVTVDGTTSNLRLTDWFNGATHATLVAGDGRQLIDSQVNSLVQAMAQFSLPPVGQTTLSQPQQDSLMPVIAASWR